MLSDDTFQYGTNHTVDFLSGNRKVTNFPQPANALDLVTSFDVLCETWVSDDLAALKELHRVLAPGDEKAARPHDRAVHIARRYTRREVVEKLQKGGFVVQLASYANTFLFPLVCLKRWGDRIFTSQDQASDLTISAGPANRLLASLLAWEAPLVARSRLPIGVSVIAVGQKV